MNTILQKLVGDWLSAIIAYLTFLNILTFVLMGLDKWAAVIDTIRLPEKKFFLLAILGGSVGILFGMFVFHHKVRKRKFFIGIPSIAFVNFSIALFLIMKFNFLV